MDFLITILVIIGVYYLIKYLVRFFAPRMLRYAARKTEQHLKKKFEQFSQQEAGNPVNKEKAHQNKKTDLKSNPTKKVGEYIDFEEVE